MKEKGKYVDNKQTDGFHGSSSDDDFQPVVLYRLRKKRSYGNMGNIKKRSKGKEADIVGFSSSTAVNSSVVCTSAVGYSSTVVGTNISNKRVIAIKSTYIFLKELDSNINFDLKYFVNKGLFVEVFTSLIDKQVRDGTSTGHSRLRDSIRSYRRIIAKHKNNYIRYADYTPPKLIKKEKLDDLQKRLAVEGYNKNMIKDKNHEEVLEPCNQIKLSISKKKMSETDRLYDISKVRLQTLLSMYETDYKFQKDWIYYDVKSRPLNHFKAFYKLQELVNYHILKSKKPLKDKFDTWGQVINLKKKTFRKQGGEKSLRFEGTIESDGIGVSIIKQNTPTNRRVPTNANKQQSAIKDNYEVKHIENLTQENLRQTVGECVLVDPGHRDLIHFRSLRKSNQPVVVKSAETALSETVSGSKARIRGFYSQLEHYYSDSSSNSHTYTTYLKVMLQQESISERLDKTEKAKLVELADDMDTQQINNILKAQVFC
ncbi:hypothetical protein BDF21DRAFT_457849 [Thamnidium elegans]|nr:hypothetical protein BDF21DRAFT_457849 [Thamnidium elegans]